MDNRPMLWDIFCRVIDNFGDIGVCWRLCADLAERGQRVRLWVDDASALHWMAPDAQTQPHANLQVYPWAQSHAPHILDNLPPADVWIEAFGCDIPQAFIAHRAVTASPPPVWINLEYLSAEPYVERSHGLASPVMHGPARGWTKRFYYPGFTSNTGGLLRESTLIQRQREFTPAQQTAWLQTLGIPTLPESVTPLRISLFCYEPLPLAALLQQLSEAPHHTTLLVTHGRASAAVRSIAGSAQQLGHVQLHYLRALTQHDYDRLLWACDLNFVRGEDSLVRALWASKPLVWQLYPQEDGAHITKLEAFLDLLQAPASLRDAHRQWNASLSPARSTAMPLLPWSALTEWKNCFDHALTALHAQRDLASQLIGFVQKNR